MSIRVSGNCLKAEANCHTLKGSVNECDPRPRCREFCNIKECDPTRSEFVCNYLEDRILPKTPHPPKLKPRELRRMGIHDYRSNHVMHVVEEFDPDQAIDPVENFD